MPNWCFTQIHISGKKKNIQELYERFSNVIERDDGGQRVGEYTSSLSRYGKRWLGNLLLAVGENVETTKIRCRGTVEYYELGADGDEISIQTETAWVPMLQCFVKFVNKYAPDAEITYCAEEPGCELYWKNDDAWEDYYVDFYEEEADEETAHRFKMAFHTEGATYMYANELTASLETLLNRKGKLLPDLIAEALRKYEDSGLRIYQFENIDLCEVD